MKVGKQTYLLDNKVYIQSAYSLAGPYEAKGNFRDYFDCVMEDDEWKCKSHEMAEIEMQRFVIGECLAKVNVSPLDCGAIMGGDLINQIVPTSFSARDFHTPFMGLYNA
ncbi:MAG: stage V sporulation protein AD, partial [Clostridia bacterium]|nr:stage V sporulation protein AD [Clostridia bacterium]